MEDKSSQLSYVEVFDKLFRFCDYQERCIWDIRRKLRRLSYQDSENAEKLIKELIDLDVLNEKRFVESFVRGKFRLKKWGPQRIKFELKSRKLNDELIEYGLSQIESDEFENQFKSLADLKWEKIKAKSLFEKKSKFLRYFYSKGYDTDTINSYLKGVKE